MPSVLTRRRLRGLRTSQFPIWDVSIPDRFSSRRSVGGGRGAVPSAGGLGRDARGSVAARDCASRDGAAMGVASARGSPPK